MKNEHPPEIIGEKKTVEKTEKVLKNSESMDLRTERVKNIFDKYEETGVPVTDKMACDLIKKEFGVTAKEFFGQGIKDEEIESIDSDIAAQLQEFVSQREENKGSTLKFLREKMFSSKFSKIVALSIILAFKFGGASFAAEKNGTPQTDGGKGKAVIEISQKVNYEGGDGDEYLYKVTKEELKNTEGSNNEITKEVYRVNMTNSFEPDQSSISTENATKIINEVNTVLDKVTPKTFKDFIETKKVIFASSSEEPTRYGAKDHSEGPKLENNKVLTDDRYNEGENIIKNAINNHDFSKSGLNPTQIQQIKDINFEKDVPVKGYKTILEANKINPETGKPFTSDEIKELKKHNYSEYKKLSDENRYVKVDFKVEIKSALEKINKYDRVMFFIDNTPSTEDDINNMANSLEKIGLDLNNKGLITKADVTYYSHKAEETKHFDDILKAAKDLHQPKIKGSSIEKPFASSLGYLQDLIKSDKEIVNSGGTPEDNRLAIFTFDEGLQEAQNILEVASLLKEAKVNDASLMFYTDGNPKPLEKNLFDIAEKVEKSLEGMMSLNLSTLKESKTDYESKLSNLISVINQKVDSKILNQVFGQEKIDENMFMSGEYKMPSNKDIKSSYVTLYNLFKLKADLINTTKALEIAENQSFEEYIKTVKLEVKKFTGVDGKKVSFDVIGDERISKDIKRLYVEL